jgi:hypothetical protein
VLHALSSLPTLAALSRVLRIAHYHLGFREYGPMSLLPGLGLSEPEEAAKSETSHHDLSSESEWRFEVAQGKYANVKARLSTPPIVLAILTVVATVWNG